MLANVILALVFGALFSLAFMVLAYMTIMLSVYGKDNYAN